MIINNKNQQMFTIGYSIKDGRLSSIPKVKALFEESNCEQFGIDHQKLEALVFPIKDTEYFTEDVDDIISTLSAEAIHNLVGVIPRGDKERFSKCTEDAISISDESKIKQSGRDF